MKRACLRFGKGREDISKGKTTLDIASLEVDPPPPHRGLHLSTTHALPNTKNLSFPAAVMPKSAVTDRARRANHPNLVRAICCLSLLIVGMDVTVVNVALPAIQEELHARLAGLQWILDAYTLVVASFLMLAGSVSDRFGRRRVFQIGLGVFTVGSVLCSRAATIEQLIGFRALQGLGASMLGPVALSIVANAFPQAKARAQAVGVWGAVYGVSVGIGPLIGGALPRRWDGGRFSGSTCRSGLRQRSWRRALCLNRKRREREPLILWDRRWF
jgi:hypothetical protein